MLTELPVPCPSCGRAEHRYCPGAGEGAVTAAQGSPMSLGVLQSWDRTSGHQIPFAPGIRLQDSLLGDAFCSPSLFRHRTKLCCGIKFYWYTQKLSSASSGPGTCGGTGSGAGGNIPPSPGCSPARCDIRLKPDLKRHPSGLAACRQRGPQVNKPQWANVPRVQHLWGGPPCPQPWCW